MIRGSSHGFPWLTLVIALFWNGIVWVSFSGGVRPAQGVSPIVVYLAVGAFVLIGLGIVYWFVVGLLRYWRFQSVTLLLDPHPASAGGELAGTVTVPVPYSAANVYHASVDATEYSAQRSGGKIRTTQQTLFQEDASVRAEPAAGGTRLRFSLALPAEAPASVGYGESLTWSSGTIDKVYLQWHVYVKADIPGVDLDETFEVPVVRSAMAAPAPRLAASPPPDPNALPELMPRSTAAAALAPAAVAARAAPAPAPAAAKPPPLPPGHNPAFQYERRGDRIRVVQPAWRKPGNVGSLWNLIAGLVPSGAFVAIGVYLLSEGVWWGVIFFFIGAVFVIGVPAYLAHELAVEIDAEGLRVVRRIGPLVFKDVRLYRAQIAAIEAAAESQAQKGGGSALTRSVRVRMRDGSVHTLAELMTRQHDAVMLRNLVAARLGLGAEARVGSARVAESGRRSALAQGEVPAPSAAWVKVAGGLLVAGFFVWQAWPFVRAFVFPERPRPQAVIATQQAAPVQRPALPAPQSWSDAFEQGRAALNERRLADAEGLFRTALEFAVKDQGAGHPAVGLVLHQLALTYERQKNPAEQEATLKRSLAVFEQHRPREAKAALGSLGNFVDQENVARYLGDMLWDQRRYADSFVYYEKAHAAALEVDVEPAVRNVKRAYTSAGVMKTACMIGKWDIADDAMKELKGRYPTVGPDVQRFLKYWIDTGEPRLKARKC